MHNLRYEELISRIGFEEIDIEVNGHKLSLLIEIKPSKMEAAAVLVIVEIFQQSGLVSFNLASGGFSMNESGSKKTLSERDKW